MDKYIEAWELIKAEINALHGEDSQIADDQKLEESIKLIDELLDDAEHNKLVIHSLEQKTHENYETIKQELKDYEELRQVIDEDTERDLKALRMVREKHISLALIDATTSHKQYNACIDESIEPLTAQEYSFIEEILK